MARRALLPLSLAVAVLSAACLGAAGRAGAADTAGVLVADSRFSPNRITVNTGDAVIFARASDAKLAHSVTADDGSFDQELTDRRAVGFRFGQPGTYAYHCRYHGNAGMAGVVVVTDAAATTTTAGPGSSTSTTATTAPGPTTTTTGPTTTTTGPTTTTTGPTTTTSGPTTTTTKPPKPKPTTTTTAPAPTTTTSPPPTSPPDAGPQPPPPPPPPASSSGGFLTPAPPSPRPAATAPKARPSGSGPAGRDASAGGGRDKSAAAPPATDPTQPPTAPSPADPGQGVALPGDPAPVAGAPAGPVAVEPIDQAILDTLAVARPDKPANHGSTMLLVGAGVALAMFLFALAAWAFYHRSSRYMPA